MRSPLSSALRIAAGSISFFLFFGCGRSNPASIRDADTAPETGGSGDTSQPDTSGALAGGGMVTGGTQAGGGDAGTGGNFGTGGAIVGAGGTASTGGTSVGAGGSSHASGTTSSGATGGRTSAGGATGTGGVSGTGGATATGGVSSAGGATATGGVSSAGGATATGGVSSAGGATATGGVSSTGGATALPTYPPRFVGNIDASSQIPPDFATYWDQFSPENAGKWGSVQGSSANTFNWTSLDRMYQYCEEHNIIFKEHCFVWGSEQPAWMGNLTTTTGPAAVQNWMKSFCDRYPKTRLIDVVNEPPPHTVPPFANAIGGGTSTTWDWIINSFKWAHEACPNAILILNDYNNAEFAADAQRTIDIVTVLQTAGAPIHAVGCQTHGAKALPSSTLKTNIDKIASATGLPVYITEYDIGLTDDAQQKAQYEDHFTMFWGNPNVKGITVWGYIVGRTWIANSGIMSTDGTMRPAMTWLMDFLGR